MNGSFRRAVIVFVCSILWGTSHLSSLDPDFSVHQYIQTHWNTERGLPDNTITAITQTKDGFLWIATPRSVYRYDGIKFTPLTIFDDQGSGYLEITCLASDRKGQLWAGTKGQGLWRYKRRHRKYKQFTPAKGISGNSIKSIHSDRLDNIWVGTYDGRINVIADQNITIHGISSGLPSEQITVVFEDSNGKTWVGTRRLGLLKFVNGSAVNVELGDFTSLDVRAISEDSRGTLWLGTNRGLIRFNDADLSYTVFDESHGLSHTIINVVKHDSDGILWIGTANGLDRYVGAQEEGTPQFEKALHETWVRAIFEDAEKNLWIGTDGKGLIQFREGRLKLYSKQNGLPNDYITSLYEDSGQNLWVGSTSGLSRFASGGIKKSNRNKIYKGSIVSSICEGPEKTIWFATFGDGLYRVSQGGAQKRYASQNGLLSDSIMSLHMDINNELWIGTDNGLNHLAGGTFKSYTRKNGLKGAIVYYLFEDSRRDIWVVYDKSYDRFERKSGTFASNDPFPLDLVISDVFEDPDKNLWLATKGNGLYLKMGETVFPITRRHGLPENYIHKIFLDTDDNLWITGKNSISSVARSSLVNVAKGQPSKFTIRRYGKHEGLKNAEITVWSQYSAIMTTNRHILMGTKQGIAELDLSNNTAHWLEPPVVIENVLINRNTPLFSTDANALSGTREMSFYFTAPTFIMPERIQFSYTLEGFDNNWIFPDAGSLRMARYTNLPPGHYTFRVKAQNGNGLWNHEGASVSFTLAPRFSETWLFNVLLAMVLLVAVLLVYFIATRTKLFKKEKYKSSTLDTEKSEQYLKQLTKLMEIDNVYRDENLSLQSLAEKLEITHYHLSQLINESLHKSFFDLINGYRVEEAKKRLENFKEDQTILAIGFEVGFNSKSAFNRVFKKYTNMTPSQYRKKHQ